MAATKEDLRSWFRMGLSDPVNTHMVILCDTFDWTDYPIYVESAERAREYLFSPGLMTRVMEVYDLRMDMEKQMAEHRAWHL